MAKKLPKKTRTKTAKQQKNFKSPTKNNHMHMRKGTNKAQARPSAAERKRTAKSMIKQENVIVKQSEALTL